jgi:hypothetical protein
VAFQLRFWRRNPVRPDAAPRHAWVDPDATVTAMATSVARPATAVTTASAPAEAAPQAPADAQRPAPADAQGPAPADATSPALIDTVPRTSAAATATPPEAVADGGLTEVATYLDHHDTVLPPDDAPPRDTLSATEDLDDEGPTAEGEAVRTGVALGFADGGAVELDPDDPRVTSFRAAAAALMRTPEK